VKIGQERNNTNIYVITGEQGGELLYDKGTYEDIQRGVYCCAIVDTSGLWFASRQFGMSLVVDSLLVWKTAQSTFRLADGFKLREAPQPNGASKWRDESVDTMMATDGF
jgi:hypothetical protein